MNPVEEWQRLTEHYRGMCDEELEELAGNFGDLTETAREVLRCEMKSRGLAMPDEKAVAARRAEPAVSPRFASFVDPDALSEEPDGAEGDEEGDSSRDYTWKTPLCECDTSEEAWQIQQVLKRAGIDSWVEGANSRSGGYPRVVVAADQLEQAIEIANQPIPQEIVEESKVELPEYEPPRCPKCGAEDPTLESAEPTNSWLCESCGEQWAEPMADADGMAEKTTR